ncbi:MAG TPA: hypothetical protein VD861_18840 [Pyrinomonadaceae bacterium]|nr:hypothetical protein [Pyrinomonadaceae bacterium]
MTPESGINQRRALFGDFSLGQLVATVLAVLIGWVSAAGLSMYVTQPQLEQRLTAVEEKQKTAVTQDVLNERWKIVERIDENVEKIRDWLLDKREHDGK